MSVTNKENIQGQVTQKNKSSGSKKNQQWITLLIIGILVTLGSAIAITFLEGNQKFYLIGGLFGLGLALILFFRPYLGAYLIIFTTFTNLSDLFTESGLPSINQPLVAVLLLVVIANLIFSPEKLVPLNKISRIEWALMAYFFVVLLSFTVATDQQLAYENALRLLKNIVILFVVFITLNSRKKIKTAIDILIITTVVLSLLGIFASLVNSDFTFWGLAQQSDIGQVTGEGELRYGGPIGLANVWGQVLVVLLPYYIYRFLGERKNPIIKLFLLSAVIIGMVAIALTGSRGAFVALLVIIPVIALELNLRATNVITVIGLGILVFITLPTTYTSRFTNLLSGENEVGQSIQSDEAVVGRLEKMQAGIEMAKDNPFLGVGIGNYSANYWDYAEILGLEPDITNIQAEENTRDAHSLYVEIVAETGLFGLATFMLFIYFLVAGVYNVLKSNKLALYDSNWRFWLAPIFISLLAYLVSGIFLHGVVFRWFWIIAGLALSAIHLTEYRFHEQN